MSSNNRPVEGLPSIDELLNINFLYISAFQIPSLNEFFLKGLLPIKVTSRRLLFRPLLPIFNSHSIEHAATCFICCVHFIFKRCYFHSTKYLLHKKNPFQAAFSISGFFSCFSPIGFSHRRPFHRLYVHRITFERKSFQNNIVFCKLYKIIFKYLLSKEDIFKN